MELVAAIPADDVDLHATALRLRRQAARQLHVDFLHDRRVDAGVVVAADAEVRPEVEAVSQLE
jgi:hypothetical protein